MNFEDIKKLANEPIFDGTTAEEFQADFQMLVSLYLDSMAGWLKETDKVITEALAQHGHQTVADAFSKSFESEVLFQVRKWISQDEFFRREFADLKRQYSKHLQSKKMQQEAKLTFTKLDTKMQGHVKMANDYGNSWTKRADNAGLVIKDRLIGTTITWFRNLTLVELKADYERGFKENG